MNWRLKVAAFKLLAGLPGGRALYQFSQKHITKSLVPAPSRVSQKMEVGLRYFDWLAEHEKTEQLLGGAHLDFGSGWHPTIPLLYYSMGVERQYLLDVSPNIDGQMVAQTLDTFVPLLDQPQWKNRVKARRLPPSFNGGDCRAYLERLGIAYYAPYEGVFESLAERVDVATSTQVLLHVPPGVMAGCLRQIYDSLKPGGLFLATVHLRDILAGCFQSGLTKYQQLRYAPEVWERWINSSLMSFNRLKAPDYKELLEKAGFVLRQFEVEAGTAEELKELDQVPIHPCFARYTREELAARHLFFVAQKQ